MYLVMAMVAVAVIATGVHVMTLTSPALAEQDRQSRAREAAAEHNIVPHAPAAATDGLPVPILVGGIVLAFAVGLTGGHLHRRQRLARRSLVLSNLEPVAPRTRTVQPPPGGWAPVPEPPAAAVVAPQPVELAPPRPEPVPEPPPPQAPPPRVIEPPAAPVAPPPAPPSEPARPAQPAEPLRLLPRAPAPGAPLVEEPEMPPLAEAPEVPVPPAAAAPAPGPVPPLGDAPESLHVPPSAEAPAPQAPTSVPGRRFARATEWPEEAARLWTCELDWKPGYRKAAFRAMAGAPGADKRQPLGESAPVKWALNAEPEPPTPALAMRVRGLVEALEAAGWEHIGRGRHWYAQRFLWRGSGTPQPVTVSGVEPAER